jgi:SSS family solute:Na+ symporter
MPVPILEVLANLKSLGRLNAMNPAPDITISTTIWSGLIGMTLFHITVYGANQMMVQRTLGAATIGEAKKAYLLMGYAAFPIYFLFFFIGVLAYGYYGGKPFANNNEIILQFAADSGVPGLLGILAAAVLAASMSTLSSAFNSMATASVVDFYQRYFKRDESDAHYLLATRWATVFWAVLIIFPAILYTRSDGSILEVISKIGSYFVGAKLGMYALGFFSKHTTERGLMVGVVAGFAFPQTVSASNSSASISESAKNIGLPPAHACQRPPILFEYAPPSTARTASRSRCIMIALALSLSRTC